MEITEQITEIIYFSDDFRVTRNAIAESTFLNGKREFCQIRFGLCNTKEGEPSRIFQEWICMQNYEFLWVKPLSVRCRVSDLVVIEFPL